MVRREWALFTDWTLKIFNFKRTHNKTLYQIDVFKFEDEFKYLPEMCLAVFDTKNKLNVTSIYRFTTTEWI